MSASTLMTTVTCMPIKKAVRTRTEVMVHVALRQECSCLIACSQGRRSGTLVQVRPAELLRGKHKDAAGDYRNDDGGQNHSRLYRIAALAATLRSSSAS